ncbi:hypothetical protein ACQP3D_28060, partial [Escherichia coli]
PGEAWERGTCLWGHNGSLKLADNRKDEKLRKRKRWSHISSFILVHLGKDSLLFFWRNVKCQ